MNAIEAGPVAKDSDGDSDPDAAGDIKTHFRVCRFMMETGKREPVAHGEWNSSTISTEVVAFVFI